MRCKLVLAFLLAIQAGCASSPKGFGVPSTLEPDVAMRESVFVATSRKPVENANIMFGAGRSPELSFARIDVSIPRDREPGKIRHVDGKPDPKRHFTVLSANAYTTGQEFSSALTEALAARPTGQRDVLLFVHGYNVPFAAGVYEAAQLRYDYQVPGIVVHYSWPSADKTALYLYDRDSAEIARNGLAATIRAVEAAKPESFALLAHSMGTMVTMESLRTLSLSGNDDTIRSIDALALAAPDIDVDVFQSQLADIKSRPKDMVVIVSENDRALKISSRLRGGEARVGQGLNKDELTAEGIIVLDVAGFREKGDPLSHSTFANSEALIRLVRGA